MDQSNFGPVSFSLLYYASGGQVLKSISTLVHVAPVCIRRENSVRGPGSAEDEKLSHGRCLHWATFLLAAGQTTSGSWHCPCQASTCARDPTRFGGSPICEPHRRSLVHGHWLGGQALGLSPDPRVKIIQVKVLCKYTTLTMKVHQLFRGRVLRQTPSRG